MADGYIAGKLAEDVFIENLGNQPQVCIYLKFISVCGSDSGAFLAAVLESEEGEEGNTGYIFVRSVYAYNSTRLSEARLTCRSLKQKNLPTIIIEQWPSRGQFNGGQNYQNILILEITASPPESDLM